MRTTVTLDDDLAARLRKLAAERGVSFKSALNEALRSGLHPGAAAAEPYRVPELDLRLREGVDLEKALTLAAEMEDRELTRKVAQRR